MGTGSELVTNGDFDTNITGWTDNSVAGGAIAWNVSGYMDLVDTTAIARADSTVITTVVGRTYVFSFDIIAGTGAYHVGTSSGGSEYVSGGTATAYVFTATATTAYIRFYKNNRTRVTNNIL